MNAEKLKAAKLEDSEFQELANQLQGDEYEWRDWIRGIESAKLEARGKKVGAFIDDIPVEFGRSIYSTGPFGNRYIDTHYLGAYRNLVRERELQHRKDRRETWALV